MSVGHKRNAIEASSAVSPTSSDIYRRVLPYIFLFDFLKFELIYYVTEWKVGVGMGGVGVGMGGVGGVVMTIYDLEIRWNVECCQPLGLIAARLL